MNWGKLLSLVMITGILALAACQEAGPQITDAEPAASAGVAGRAPPQSGGMLCEEPGPLSSDRNLASLLAISDVV